ncbi:DnaA ATPase domain-containing protein [Parablautia intestinalis]|nr:DnaA/Hda family protein [Parablautia intestinalis]
MEETNEFLQRMEKIRAKHSGMGRYRQYKCPLCEDRGFIVQDDGKGHDVAKKCRCYAVTRAKELMEQSGISEELCRKTFENYNPGRSAQLEKAKAKAEGYARDFINFEQGRHNSILLSGQVGAGKTHLGMAICNTLLNLCNVGVVYMSYRNAVMEIKQTVMDKENYYAIINRYCNARLLYIDDLLKGRSTEADLNILYEIINYRYMHNKPMVISTEKLPESLIEFDEAVGSRILEMCRGNIVILNGLELNYRMKL